jgi:hypothetical protein
MKLTHYTEALSSTPKDMNCLLNCALTYYHFLVTEKRAKSEETKEEVVLSPKDLLVIKTDELFNRALKLDKVWILEL